MLKSDRLGRSWENVFCPGWQRCLSVGFTKVIFFNIGIKGFLMVPTLPFFGGLRLAGHHDIPTVLPPCHPCFSIA